MWNFILLIFINKNKKLNYTKLVIDNNLYYFK